MDALTAAHIFLFEDFRLDRSGLSRRDHSGPFVPVPLGSRALEILAVLVARAGELVTRDEIIKEVWPGTIVEYSNLPVQIAALRRILDEGRPNGSCIQTIPGRGYRFAAAVTQRDAGGSITGSASASTGAPVTSGDVPSIGFSASAPPNKPPSRKQLRSRQRVIAGVFGALLFVAAGLAVGHLRSSGSDETRPPPRLSIVVLPFADLSAARDQRYFADGVTEDLTTDLSRMSGMVVISPDTALTYRDKPIGAKEIARELGVRYVVEGSLERSGSRVRVNAQLIDARTDAHLWAERFDREIADLFELQSEITGRIAFALNLEMVVAEADRHVEDPDALDYVFRGRERFFGRPPSRATYDEAIRLYERALELAPQSAEAKTYLAGALINRVFSFPTEAAPRDLARAGKLIDEVLAAGARIPWAHYVKGSVLRAEGRWADAIPEFEAALALNRNMTGALQGLGWCKLFTGSLEEVIPLAEKAIRIGPNDPSIGFRYLQIGEVHDLEGRPDEAIGWFEKAQMAMPAYAGARAHLAADYALTGAAERATAELAAARRLNPHLYSSLAVLEASQPWGVPKVQALFASSYFTGLRKAGIPAN